MSPLRLRSAPTPRAVLHRLGRLPDPLDWPPADRIGANRFDDPARHFRVLYAARQRTACFAETLAAFRPSLELLAETGDPADITGDVSAGFLRARGPRHSSDATFWATRALRVAPIDKGWRQQRVRVALPRPPASWTSARSRCASLG